jgi:polyisoprenoid-binding protein YceI
MRFLSLLLVATLLSTPVLAETKAKPLPGEATGTYRLDKSHANIIFKLSHLGYSDYIGRFNDFDATLTLDAAKPATSKVEATIKPKSVDTNNETLEGKLKGEHYFNADQFPEIKFVSTTLKQTGVNKGVMMGDLTLLGVSKPVSLDVTFVGAGQNPYASVYTVGFRATGTIKRSDWGMKTLVPQVGDEVQLLIEAEFHKVEAEEGAPTQPINGKTAAAKEEAPKDSGTPEKR